jgi:hypothetical protein
LFGAAGKRLLAAVKPSALIAVSGIDRIVELVAEQISPSVADFVVLITEEKLSQVDLFNVQAVNMATRALRPEDDAAIAKVVRGMNGQASIGELVERSTLGGYGYDAVVRSVFGRPPSPSMRLPTPVAPKAGPVPTHERLGPYDRENLQD